MLRYGKSTGGLLLAGIAAFAAYKFSRMNAQQKKDLVDNLKDKGRKIFGQFMPESKSASGATTPNGQHYGEGSQYSS